MSFDAVVVGSGPNGLAAAITLARAGRSVVVLEAEPVIGGGLRSEALTLPGFLHDVCSAVHPLALTSALFHALPLTEHGLEWIDPPLALAHPFDDRPPAILERSIPATCESLGRDGDAYRRLMEPLADRWRELASDVLAPLHWPRHPLRLARFGLAGLQSAHGLFSRRFEDVAAASMLGGISGHSMVPLDRAGTAAFALVLAAASHAVGWPIPRGGSVSIANALASYLRTLGGEIHTGTVVRSLRELPPSRIVLLDLTPRQVLAIAGDALPSRYRASLARFRYGPGTFKMDWALDGPVPWRWPDCGSASTVHLAGAFAELVASEAAVWRGEHPERPLVVTAQPSRFDPSRAPAGKHTLWGYCHVPHGSDVDMTSRIEAQVERFAPGFRDRILARSALGPAGLEAHNANLIGGDIGGGANTLDQLFFRPTVRWRPYATPNPRLYLCSASTPPGGGVHGLCGFFAAKTAIERYDWRAQPSTMLR